MGSTAPPINPDPEWVSDGEEELEEGDEPQVELNDPLPE